MVPLRGGAAQLRRQVAGADHAAGHVGDPALALLVPPGRRGAARQSCACVPRRSPQMLLSRKVLVACSDCHTRNSELAGKVLWGLHKRCCVHVSCTPREVPVLIF